MKGRLFCQLSALLLVLFGFAESATSQEDLCETKKLCFPVVGTAEQPALAIETQGGFYRGGTTDAEVRKKLQGFSEIEKLAVPEYLILKELAITKTGTFDDFLANYHGEDGKKYARGIVSDFAELQKYSKTVKALSFQCKLLHGDLVRIRYQRQYDDGRQMDWSSILKKIEGRYYFVALEEEHIFHGIAEAFWHLRGRGVCKKEALTSLQGISFVAENAQYPLAAYIKPVASKKDDPLITFLNKWIKVCQEGTVDDIVACYSDGLSTTMLREDLSSGPDALKQFRQEFSGLEKVEIGFMVADKSTAAVSVIPIKNGKKVQERMLLVVFANGKPRINYLDSSISIQVLQHKTVREQLRKPNGQ